MKGEINWNLVKLSTMSPVVRQELPIQPAHRDGLSCPLSKGCHVKQLLDKITQCFPRCASYF